MLRVESLQSGVPLNFAAEKIPLRIFSNEDVEPTIQFEAWRHTVKTIMEVMPIGGQEDNFPARIEAWDLGRIALLRTRTPPAGFRRTLIDARNTAIDHWTFTAVKTGQFQTYHPGGPRVTVPGVLFVQSMHSPMEGALDDAVSLSLFVPRDFLRERVAAIDAVDETIVSSGLARLLADYLIDLDRQLPKLTEDDLPGVLAATHAMIEACIATTPDRLAAASRPINATLLERARKMIRQNLHVPEFGVDELCLGLGLSRSRLYRLFEDIGGVMHYVRSQRLAEAHRVLASPANRRSITEIALERHFSEPAQFSRAFKREFGYSPGAAREIVSPGQAVSAIPANANDILDTLIAGLQ